MDDYVKHVITTEAEDYKAQSVVYLQEKQKYKVTALKENVDSRWSDYAYNVFLITTRFCGVQAPT